MLFRSPPPSHQHNLAPTFITTPQIDYTNLFTSLLHTTAKVKDPVPIRNPVTPLSSTLQSVNLNAEQMAAIAALGRAGKTAGSFQPLPSQSDNRTDTRPEAAKNVDEALAKQVQASYDVKDKQTFEQKVERTKEIRREVRRPPPRQGQAGQGTSGGGLPRNEAEIERRQAYYLQQQQQALSSLKSMGL